MNKVQQIEGRRSYLVAVIFSLVTFPWRDAVAEVASDFFSAPPLVDVSGAVEKPNILMILDNSNSMDERDNGSAVGSDNAISKSEISRNALKTMITNFGSSSRMGLMAYKQQSVSSQQLHDSQYDVSFDKSNFDEDHEEGIASQKKQFEVANTSDPDPDARIYYNVALPFYSGSSSTAFCYTTDPKVQFPDGGDNSEFYRCYSKKVGDSDTDLNEFSTNIFNTSFSPTDSDTALGISDFGKFITWFPVGPTWFSNQSPGKGMLHVAIDDVDTSQTTKLFNKLATSQFVTSGESATLPLRNAGLTPLEGTLQSAKDYFCGSLASSEAVSGVSRTSPPVSASGCPTQNYVVLVTDGMPSTDSSGADVADAATGIAAVAQAAQDLADEGVKTYVVGFALPVGADAESLNKIAEAGGTGTAYLASDSDSLNTALGNIFLNIINRTSSATGAAVLANNASGDGLVIQAVYSPETEDILGNTVQWTGGLNALFIDRNGVLREDTNQNGVIDDYLVDMSVQYFYDDTAGRTKVGLYKSGLSTTPPTFSGSPTSTVELSELNAVWKAQEQLSLVSDVTNQRTYEALASSGRYILTSLDGENTVEFSEAEAVTNGPLTSHLMFPGSAADDYNLINYIRGKEISGYRSRVIDIDGDGTAEVHRLGDIVHSSPATVRVPSALYDTKNKDATYAAFREKYENRRQMVYVGANDGMIHAFNGGFWDDSTKAYTTTDTSEVAHPLGAELWAYIPRTALPHLQWLKDTGYSHIYYVDGEPIIFDANVFATDDDHPYGWGTILVMGMRLGGGDFNVDSDNDGTPDTTLYSSYVVLDITNPEEPPVLMAEISDLDMGYTTGVPSVVKNRVPAVENDFKGSMTSNVWKLVIGSGPTELSDVTSDQDPRFYMFDLTSKSFDSGFSPKVISGVGNAFVGDIASIDWGADYHDDISYFGLVGGTPAASTGRVMRIRFDSLSTSMTPIGLSTLMNTGRPTFARPHLSTDGKGRAWVHFGTGRLLDEDDNTSAEQQRYYGVYENTDGLYGTISTLSLFDSTDIRVFDNGAVDRSGSPITIDGESITTFNQLAVALPDFHPGWYRDLDTVVANPSGRNITASAQARTVVFFTEYTPSDTTCQPEGDSKLFAVDYRTGTASSFATFGVDSGSKKIDSNGDVGFLASPSIDLGRGMASAPIIGTSTSSQHVSVIIQKSTGEINTEDAKVGVVIQGRQSWREIEF
ncbi:hypothetical protein A9Q81_04845 [Gammaproteobacteria bacterium 42_54_T18]|nr:hypothetical protein A9Q81_04845 [Gammaproteobacteria bacterium 42_54_T18]